MACDSPTTTTLRSYVPETLPTLIAQHARPKFFFDQPLTTATTSAACPICSRPDCSRHAIANVHSFPLTQRATLINDGGALQNDRSRTHPWEQILVHPEIDNVRYQQLCVM